MEDQPREFELEPPGGGDDSPVEEGSRRRFRRPATGAVEAPTLGYVAGAERSPAPAIAEPEGATATAYLQAIERLQATNTDDLFLVTGVGRGSNAGDVALNLAAAAVTHGLRTVLIDADPAGNGPTRYLRTGSGAGLAELAAGAADLKAASRLLDIGPGKILPVIPAGADLGKGSIATTHLADAIDRITEHSDLVLVAVPPGSSDDEMTALGAHADGSILTISSGDGKRAAARAEKMAAVGAPVVGIIEHAPPARRAGRRRS